MAPINALAILSTLLALSATTIAQTGTISGFPVPPISTGAPFPLSNSTIPYGPTGTGTGSFPGVPTGPSGGAPGGGSPASVLPSSSGSGCEAGSTCASPVTVTTTIQATVTVTVPAGGSEAGSTAPASGAPTGPPYSIPGGSGTGPVGTGTAASTGFAMPTGYVQKRFEMRGLNEKRENKERRGVFWS